MLLVTVEYGFNEQAFVAQWGDIRWTLGDSPDKAHSALCNLDAKVIYQAGSPVSGLYAIRAEKVPGYGDK